MRALLLKAWLRPLVVGLSLWLGICGGSWATMHWLSARIQARIQTTAALDMDIEGGPVRGAARRLPGPSALEGGHPTSREAVERVKELYDRVRTAVDAGLGEVVRAEQRRHCEQVKALQQRVDRQAEQSETLRRQVERLTGQMTRLARDYGTLAATLRGRWR